jgi:MFS family permease
MNGIHAGAWFTLGPAIARDSFGVRGWGYILSAESVGLMLMTLVMLRVRIARPLLTGLIRAGAFAVPLLMLGLDPHVVPLVVAAFLAGAGMEVFGIGWSVTMQEHIDEHVLSRAYSYDALGSLVAMPLGQIIYGPLGEAFGYRPVLVASGCVYLGVVLLVLSSRSVRTLRRTAEPVPELTTPTAR